MASTRFPTSTVDHMHDGAFSGGVNFRTASLVRAVYMGKVLEEKGVFSIQHYFFDIYIYTSFIKVLFPGLGGLALARGPEIPRSLGKVLIRRSFCVKNLEPPFPLDTPSLNMRE